MVEKRDSWITNGTVFIDEKDAYKKDNQKIISNIYETLNRANHKAFNADIIDIKIFNMFLQSLLESAQVQEKYFTELQIKNVPHKTIIK